jgi:alkylation response protein AidB-like acyl-CoA dehydrogenase
MEFTFNEEQLAVQETAEKIFTSMVTPDRVGFVEATGDRVDRELWSALAAADLLGIALPVDYGGGGLGLTELCLILEAQGTTVAPVPLWSTLVLGAPPLVRFGSAEQQQTWLPRIVRGEVMASGGLVSAANSPTAKPSVHAVKNADGWQLRGVELAVPQAHLAAFLVMPARTEDGSVIVALVDPKQSGVRLERAITTNREIHPHVHLDDVVIEPGAVLVGPEGGAAALAWMLETAWTGLCAIQVGVCESALTRTAAYLNQRHQFDRPLSTFQGTMLKAADAAIDIEAMRVTLWQAAWRLDTGRDSAEAVAVAKWQAAERGQRAVHATQHLHGGMGADITYPIHRHFLWGKQIELALGGPSNQLARLGSLLADRFLKAAEVTK